MKTKYIIWIVVALAVIAGLVWYFKRNKQTTAQTAKKDCNCNKSGDKQPDKEAFKTVKNVLYFNEKPYTGFYQEKIYVKGIEIKGNADTLTSFEFKNNLLYMNGELYTGKRDGISYKDGKRVEYEMIDNKLYKNGVLYNGYYQGSQWKEGIRQNEPPKS